MWRRSRKEEQAPAADVAAEMKELEAAAIRSALEAGFLGIEDHFGERLRPLVMAAGLRIFGEVDAEYERARTELEEVEQECDTAEQMILRFQAGEYETHGGWLKRLAQHFWAYWDYRTGHWLLARRKRELLERRKKLAVAGRMVKAAGEWTGMALESFPAVYRFHRARGVMARAE